MFDAGYFERVRRRPMLGLRADAAISNDLEAILQEDELLKTPEFMEAIWWVYLAKNGFSKTAEFLERQKVQIPETKYQDLYSQTLAICARFDEEREFLLQCERQPWVRNRITQNAIRRGDIGTVRSSVQQMIESGHENSINQALNVIWSLGLNEIFSEFRDEFSGLQEIGFYDLVFQSYASTSAANDPASVIYIEKELARLSITRESFANIGMRPSEYRGLDGSLIPNAVLENLKVEAGIFGAASSHLALWEQLAQSGGQGMMIFEVDAAPVYNFSGNRENLAEFDFVFLNDRAVSIDYSLRDSIPANVVEYIPPESQIGTDGYYISRAIAGSLLDKFRDHGVQTHVDIQTFRYLREWAEEGKFRIGHVAFPFVRHFAVGGGTRRAMELNY